MKPDVPGILLPDRKFVFYLDNYAQRQLVLTNNDGEVIASGYLLQPNEHWTESASWKTTDYFSIVNFRGTKGEATLYNFSCHCYVVNCNKIISIFFYFWIHDFYSKKPLD